MDNEELYNRIRKALDLPPLQPISLQISRKTDYRPQMLVPSLNRVTWEELTPKQLKALLPLLSEYKV